VLDEDINDEEDTDKLDGLAELEVGKVGDNEDEVDEGASVGDNEFIGEEELQLIASVLIVFISSDIVLELFVVVGAKVICDADSLKGLPLLVA
jgi:hypothetical protein